MPSVWETNNGVYLGYASRNLRGVPDVPGDVPLRYADERSLITYGPNGSGKSRSLLLTNLFALRDWSVLVIDPKGQLAWQTAEYRAQYGKVIFLNPYEALGIMDDGFNPLSSLDPGNDEFSDDALAMAEAIIQIEGKDPHFPASAQDLFTALMMYAVLQDDPMRRNLAYVRELLCKPSLEFREVVKAMRVCGVVKDWEELSIKAGRYMDIGPENEELNSILSTAMTQTRWLDSRPIKKSTSMGHYDFARMKEEPITIYLILPAKRLETQAPWLRLVITCALNRLMNDTTFHVPTMLMLDEFGQLGNLPSIDRYQALMRGYGVKMWAVLQDINQGFDTYGKRWESFIANAGVIQAFAPRDPTTAEYLSKLTGQTTAMVMSRSGSVDARTGIHAMSENLTFSPAPVPGMLPQDIINMDKGYGLLFTHLTKGFVKSYMPDPSDMDMLSRYIRPLP